MIFVRENNRIYIAECTYITSGNAQKDSGCLLENMPVLSVPGSTALIAGAGYHWKADLDRLRYLHFSFPKTLTVPALHKLIPKISNSIDEIGRLKCGKIQIDLAFAKGDEGFIFTDGSSFKEIESLETIGWRSTEFRYAMMVNSHLPVPDRIREAFRLVGQYSDANLFPVVLWDTKSRKPILIEEDN